MYTLYNTPETVDLIEAVNVFLKECEDDRIARNKRDNVNWKVIPTVETIKELISKFHPRDGKYVDIDDE